MSDRVRFTIIPLITICVAVAMFSVVVWFVSHGSPGSGIGSQAVSEEWDTRNREVTLLGSDGRITSTNSAAQNNYNHLGLVLFVDVTGRDGYTSLTPNLQVQEPVGDGWVTVWTATSAISSSDTTIAYLFYPSTLTDAAALYTEGVDMVVPRRWRATTTHSDTDVITYSVSCSLLK